MGLWAYIDFVILDRDPVVAQLSKLALWESDAGNQDRLHATHKA